MYKSVKSMGILALFSIALAGCNATANSTLLNAEDTAKATLQNICTYYQPADAAFGVIVAVLPPGKIPAKVIDAEAKGVIALNSICAKPPTNIAETIQAATKAYADVLKAMADAKAARGPEVAAVQ